MRKLGHPIGADPERFHLIAPYETDPRQWEVMQWIDQYSKRQALSDQRFGAHGSRTVARVKSYGDVLREYEYPSRSEMRRCQRRSVQEANRLDSSAGVTSRSIGFTYIGKESNRLEEVEEAGRFHAKVTFIRVFVDARRDEWAVKWLPILKAMPDGRADGREWIVSTRALHDPSGSAPTTRECRYPQIDREGARQVRLANLGYTLGLSAAVAMLFACGGSQPSIGLVPSTGVPDHLPNHKPFYYTGAAQHFRVPEGVTLITVVARGAKGAGARVAFGGRVHALIRLPRERGWSVTSAATRPEKTGFNGGANGGYMRNATPGYGGGGASDVRQGGDQLVNRILVAGGGGGRGGAGPYYSYRGGAGGKGGGYTGGSGGNARIPVAVAVAEAARSTAAGPAAAADILTIIQASMGRWGLVVSAARAAPDTAATGAEAAVEAVAAITVEAAVVRAMVKLLW